jgi:hypothetical protein
MLACDGGPIARDRRHIALVGDRVALLGGIQARPVAVRCNRAQRVVVLATDGTIVCNRRGNGVSSWLNGESRRSPRPSS